MIIAVNNDIKSSKAKTIPRDNLTKSDIIITKAYSAGVILNINDYIGETTRKLNDTNNYEQWDFDPTELHTEKIRSEIHKQLKKWKPPKFKTANWSNFYLRFIDDIFLIWNGAKTEFESFCKKY